MKKQIIIISLALLGTSAFSAEQPNQQELMRQRWYLLLKLGQMKNQEDAAFTKKLNYEKELQTHPDAAHVKELLQQRDASLREYQELVRAFEPEKNRINNAIAEIDKKLFGKS